MADGKVNIVLSTVVRLKGLDEVRASADEPREQEQEGERD